MTHLYWDLCAFRTSGIWHKHLCRRDSHDMYLHRKPQIAALALALSIRGFSSAWQGTPNGHGSTGASSCRLPQSPKTFLESQWPIILGYFQGTMGYFGVSWPSVLGYVAFQIWARSSESSGLCCTPQAHPNPAKVSSDLPLTMSLVRSLFGVRVRGCMAVGSVGLYEFLDNLTAACQR